MRLLPRKNNSDLSRSALVVEADRGTRDICRATLESLGFSVKTVDSGVTALAAARESKPDIVLFDLQLRDVRGAELVQWIRGNPELRNVPMIAISVLAGDAELAPLDGQVAGFVKKPVSRAVLKSTIRETLGLDRPQL